MKKHALLILSLAFLLNANAQSYSSIDEFLGIMGTDVLRRYDNTNTYSVTYLTPGRCTNLFVVMHGDTAYYFDFWEPPFGTMPIECVTGYTIYDIEMLGRTCYFCGSRWRNTGNLIYNLDGTSYYEIDSVGFIGRFNVVEVMAGSGSYEILKIEHTSRLERIAPTNCGAEAVGTLADHATRCMVELRDHVHSSGYIDYSYRVVVSSRADETIMDVVNSGAHTVTLSRFKEPSVPDFANSFALRYGSYANFYSTNAGHHIYDVNMAYPMGEAVFTTLGDVHLSATNVGEGVVVSYLGEAPSDLHGQAFLYRFDNPGQSSTEIQNSVLPYSHRRIVDARFNRPLVETTRMAMLLDDESGMSMLRFPLWGMTNDYGDTTFVSYEHKITTIDPYQHMSDELNVLAGGYSYAGGNRLTHFLQRRIHDSFYFWFSHACLPHVFGKWHYNNMMIEPGYNHIQLQTCHYMECVQFEKNQFKSHKTIYVNKCSDNN